MDSSGVTIVSFADTQANVAQAAQDADVAQVAICAPSSAGLDLVDVDVIQRMGRRRVLRLPDRRQTSGLGRRVLKDRSAHPFARGVTVQDIDDLIDAGGVVEVVKEPTSAGVLPLAAVRPDGTVNLQPSRDAPGPEDTVIALVSRPAQDPQALPG
jgi:hypothetical protein